MWIIRTLVVPNIANAVNGTGSGIQSDALDGKSEEANLRVEMKT